MTPDMECTNQSTPCDLKLILQLPDKQAEEAIFNRIRHVARIWELSYAEVGLLCRAVESYLLYEQRIDPDTGEPCASFSRWMILCAPRSYSTCRAAMRDVESLSDMPDEAIAQIPASNFAVVKQLSTAVRNDPQVIQAVATKRTEDLVEHLKGTHPDQHIQYSSFIRVPLNEEQKAEFDEAVKRAQMRGAANLSEAVWAICIEVNREWELEEELQQAIVEAGHVEDSESTM